MRRFPLFLLALLLAGCSSKTQYDVLIKNATIYDGSGSAPFRGSVAINADTIAAVGDIGPAHGNIEINARGMAVSPGFINMLSWATETLIMDGRSLSDIKQGVTLEVFGEGWSMGPLNDTMKQQARERQGDYKYDIEWTTLREYLEYLQNRGISTNVASFIGATTVRIYVLGYEDRPPTKSELEQMRQLVREAMEDGALGVASALIYAPGFYAKTDELIELAKVAAEYDGMYVSHMRSEGNRLLKAVDELITIAREAGIRAEIYHLKAAGQNNWDKLAKVFQKVEAARKEGLHITADMYCYTAGATGLSATMPPWVQEGGFDAWKSRLKDPAIRKKVIKEMRTPTDEWENLLLMSGGADNVLLVGFKTDSLKHLTGKTLAEVAKMRGKSPEETAIDLVIQDDSRVEAVYFIMSEDNVRRKIQTPWVSFCSDAGSLAPEGVFLKFNPHPRAYGNFARLLGRYVRDEKLIALEEAIRRLTSFPAQNLRIQKRGLLKPGYYADVVVFDPDRIQDRATYEKPHQLAVGVEHVFVNGVQVLKNGEHTGATPGRVVYGPGLKR
ncbi:MAG: D-aminoacylase [candidate division KSB1 bacterium]|nr:D-aminoacylase [candidate division KSB1 bacterium]